MYVPKQAMKITEQILLLKDHIKKELIQEELSNQYAWWLLEKVTGKSKTELITQSNVTLNSNQQIQLNQWITEIVEHHKPIAYILGDIPFGPISIAVKPPVLIPRPETEEWVLELAEQVNKSGAHTINMLDLCTGSGCIACLCATILPHATIYAVDICNDALALAQENKKRLQLNNIICIQSDLFDHIPAQLKFDLILANPPYITAQEYYDLDLSVSNWEHKHALYSDNEGLFHIQKIIERAPSFIKPNKTLYQHGIHQLYIEIGWQQGQHAKKLMEKNGYADITIFKDSAGKDRVISGRIIHVATATY